MFSPDNNTQACSGNGQCDCNHCYCDKNSQGDDELFYGQYCECIKYDCDADGDLRECGGQFYCEEIVSNVYYCAIMHMHRPRPGSL